MHTGKKARENHRRRRVSSGFLSVNKFHAGSKSGQACCDSLYRCGQGLDCGTQDCLS